MKSFWLLAAVSLAGAAYVPGKAFDRFITIWLENQDFAKVSKDTDIVDLTKEGILLTEYYGLTHPSQPNYIASVGGDYFGLNHDGFVRIPKNVSTLVDLLDTQGISWRGYFEGIPGPGFMGEGSTIPGTNKYIYVRKHNPFVSYDSINLNSTRLQNILSFTEFASDVKANTLPQYMHLSPDMLNDGHDTSLEYASNWTQSFLTPLLANPQFMEKTLILLTYDESATYPLPNKIASLLLGGAIPKELKGTKDATVYNHYSILSSLENNWNLPCLGRYDVGANVFSFMASITGYVNHAPSNQASINNSLSYPGFLNDKKENYLPIPAPNLALIGAGGKGVERMVGVQWAQAKNSTPYDGSGRFFDGGNGTVSLQAPVYGNMVVAENFTATATATGTGAGASETKKSGGERVRGLGLRIVLAVMGMVVLM